VVRHRLASINSKNRAYYRVDAAAKPQTTKDTAPAPKGLLARISISLKPSRCLKRPVGRLTTLRNGYAVPKLT